MNSNKIKISKLEAITTYNFKFIDDFFNGYYNVSVLFLRNDIIDIFEI